MTAKMLTTLSAAIALRLALCAMLLQMRDNASAVSANQRLGFASQKHVFTSRTETADRRTLNERLQKRSAMPWGGSSHPKAPSAMFPPLNQPSDLV